VIRKEYREFSMEYGGKMKMMGRLINGRSLSAGTRRSGTRYTISRTLRS
jgi:hypothetical protein